MSDKKKFCHLSNPIHLINLYWLPERNRGEVITTSREACEMRKEEEQGENDEDIGFYRVTSEIEREAKIWWRRRMMKMKSFPFSYRFLM